MIPLGYIWDGKFFLLGEPGPVSVERFNEVVGGDMGNGWTLSFEEDDGPDLDEESGL